MALNENSFWAKTKYNKTAEQSQGIDPYVNEIQATARSGFAVRAAALAPTLIQQQRNFTNFLFQIDHRDDVDSDVPVEMGLRLGFGPDQMEEVTTPEESRLSISVLLILNLDLGISF